MSGRAETPSYPTKDLFGGDFRRGRTYTNWRPQGSGDWLLIYTAGGAGYLTTDSASGPTEVGEVVLFSPGELQDYRTETKVGRWHLLWVHFHQKPAWHSWLQWPRGRHGVKSLHLERGEVRTRFQAALRRLLQLRGRQLPNAMDLAFNALEEALLWAHPSDASGRWRRLDPRIRRAMDYLAADLRQPFRLDGVARHCGLSASRLGHLFKQETGRSPQLFFEDKRMEHASQLLRRTGLGIAEVANEVGYDDPFYFSNRFRRHTGKSPTHFRRTERAL